jgi:hypothetical protein
MLAKVTVHERQGNGSGGRSSFPTTVEVDVPGEGPVVAEADYAPGDIRAAAFRGVLQQKFRDLAARVVPQGQAAEAERLVDALDDLPDVRELTRVLGGAEASARA